MPASSSSIGGQRNFATSSYGLSGRRPRWVLNFHYRRFLAAFSNNARAQAEVSSPAALSSSARSFSVSRIRNSGDFRLSESLDEPARKSIFIDSAYHLIDMRYHNFRTYCCCPARSRTHQSLQSNGYHASRLTIALRAAARSKELVRTIATRSAAIAVRFDTRRTPNSRN